MRPEASADADANASARLTRTDEAHAEIKRRILDLEMAPGTWFTEASLTAEMGLSRTPVREALGRLRQERLVDAAARSGYQVAPVTLKDAHDLFQVRSLLETEAAGLAAERGGDIAALQELDALCHTSYDPTDRASVLGFIKANARFHVTLARMGGNDVLASMLEYVLDRLHRPFALGLMHARPEDIIHEHVDLLDAVKAGDGARARRVAADQASSSQRMVINGLLAMPTLQSTNLGAVAR